MVALQRAQKLKAESIEALQLLASSPRGATEDVLEIGHGFSRETVTTLTLAGLAKLVTETRGRDAHD
jgi:hypothetical protein